MRHLITQGFWKNILFAVGLVGAAFSMTMMFFLGGTLCLLLTIVSIFTASLAIFIPWEYVYCCRDARVDIALIFSLMAGVEGGWKDAQERVMTHMKKDLGMGFENVSCQKCWEYYVKMKHEHFDS